MSNVRVISPDGRETYVKPEDLSKALSAGYKQADPVATAAGEETGAAFGTGLARGLTLGLSDQLDLPGAPRRRA